MSDLTITTKELAEAAAGLREIGSYSIPDAKGSYALMRIKKAAPALLETLEALRVEKCEQYAEKDDMGKAKIDDKGQYVFADRAGFDAAWKTILAEPVTLSGCRALTVDELQGASLVIRFPDDPKHIEIIRGIPSDVLFSLGPLVVDSPPQPAAGS